MEPKILSIQMLPTTFKSRNYGQCYHVLYKDVCIGIFEDVNDAETLTYIILDEKLNTLERNLTAWMHCQANAVWFPNQDAFKAQLN